MEEKEKTNSKKPTCGIIMPISKIDDCSEEHWLEILSIFKDAINNAGFEGSLVSDSDDISIIQKTIIQNVYNSDIVVCDVSGKNPNVMFELGLRLAFDRPTIIVKDDATDYSFDTSVIEHLEYPRDLRFTKIISFKEKLAYKVTATHDKAKSDPHYSTFLRNFGQYKIAHLENKEVSSDEYILETLKEIKNEIRTIKREQPPTGGLGLRPRVKKTLSKKSCNIVDKHIDEFCAENKIDRSIFHLSSFDENEGIITYLKSKDEVRDTCQTPDMLQEILKHILFMCD